MCTWFYAEKSVLSPIITKAQQLPLADTIRNTMSPTSTSPTDNPKVLCVERENI